MFSLKLQLLNRRGQILRWHRKMAQTFLKLGSTVFCAEILNVVLFLGSERKGYHRDVASGVDRAGGSATGVTRRCGAELYLVRPWALAGLLHGTRCRRRFCWDGVCDRRPGRTMPALFFGCCFGSLHSSKLVAQNFLTASITLSAVSLRNKPSRVISVKSVSQC